MTSKCVQASQLSETLSTCRFAQRMMQVTVDAQKNKGGMSSVHGNLFKLDPVMQQYLEVSPQCASTIFAVQNGQLLLAYTFMNSCSV